MNNLQKLAQLGQSIWYDNISRGLIQRGELKALVDQGCLGVTSNPTIFDKAISGSTDYDGQIRELVEKNPGIDVEDMIQELMIADIQMATDVLRPAWDRTNGLDGYVSVEVSPGKARDTTATIDEVRYLWSRIHRRNLMIKIPATQEGLPAIEQSIAEGININVTLIFSEQRYREVARAYVAGLERRRKAGTPVDRVASVASVFVSRVDTLVDDLITKNHPAHTHLLGKAAVANAKLIYRAFKEEFASSQFKELEHQGAKFQRPLWGSTGTKNPAYNDLLYVNTLIGPHTVNTVPPTTYAAILDHGTPAITVESDLNPARTVLREIASMGINLDWVMKKLEDDGVASFEKSFDSLYSNLLDKRRHVVEANVSSH